MESETSDRIECFKEGDIITRTMLHCEIKRDVLTNVNSPTNINRIPIGPPLRYIKIENGKIHLKVDKNDHNFKEGEEIVLDYHKFHYGWAKYEPACMGYESIINITKKDLENRLNVFS